MRSLIREGPKSKTSILIADAPSQTVTEVFERIPRVLLLLYSIQMALRTYERMLGSEGILMKCQFSPGFGTLFAATALGTHASLFNARVKRSNQRIRDIYS